MKGLGQHFLCSPSSVDSIVRAIEGAKSILEIGPGPGILTHRLAENGRRVVAVELDSRMFSALQTSSPTVEIIQKDALLLDWKSLLLGLERPRYIVSNLPYYITGALLQKTIESWSLIDGAVLMMQKEVAERVIAQPGTSSRGSLSVHIQALFKVEKLAFVSRNSFLPPPKVDSVILTFEPRPSDFPAEFFSFMRSGFTQPRKTLANNLLSFASKEQVKTCLTKMQISPTIRAQQLDESQWKILFSELAPV